jgi:hypothetical protein
MFLHSHAGRQFERIALRKGCGVTAFNRKWVAKGEQRIVGTLTPRERNSYF